MKARRAWFLAAAVTMLVPSLALVSAAAQADLSVTNTTMPNPGEHDIARPAEFLIDSSGTVRWVNLTENYWVRSTPAQMLEAANLIQ